VSPRVRVPVRAPIVRAVMRPRVLAERGRRTSEYVKPHRPRDVEPITLIGKPGSKCRPFLKVEKDQEKFAACNALADEIGPLDTPKKAFRVIEDAIGDEVNEVFGVMMLDLHLRLKGLAEIGRGEPTSVMAPLKPTLQMALIDGAHAIILFHCHPSGIEAEPSDADSDTTDAFADACEAIDLPLLDHIITAGDVRNRSYYSFLEAGDL
jgi:DNA repair protein RadC